MENPDSIVDVCFNNCRNLPSFLTCRNCRNFPVGPITANPNLRFLENFVNWDDDKRERCTNFAISRIGDLLEDGETDQIPSELYNENSLQTIDKALALWCEKNYDKLSKLEKLSSHWYKRVRKEEKKLRSANQGDQTAQNGREAEGGKRRKKTQDEIKQGDHWKSSGCLTASQGQSQGSLRMIVVDGSNVGMANANRKFRAQALSIVYVWFSSKGHEVLIILPRSRWNRARGKDRDLLDRLEKDQILFFTPTRRTKTGSWDVYDDRYIVKEAAKHKGIIVSNDNYRDLIDENPEYKDQIENRLLPFTFINEKFEPPDDPMGKNGPMLQQFLRH